MKPEPVPCSTRGRPRNCGKKSSKPGGRRRVSTRSWCWDWMNTTAGLTCSATATNAWPRSVAGLAAGMNGRVAGCCNSDACAALPCPRRSCAEANASPSTNANPTSAMNLSQSLVRTDTAVSPRKGWLLFVLVVVHDLVCRLLLEKKNKLYPDCHLSALYISPAHDIAT